MARFANISIISFENYRFDAIPKYDVEQYKQNVMQFLREKIEQVLPDNPDLIVLPECSNRVAGLTPEQRYEYYFHVGDSMQRMMSDIARENKVNIAYGAVRIVGNDPEHPLRNSVMYFDRQGNVAGIYDKNHLVPNEYDKHSIEYGAVPEALIELDIGKVATVLCFDLNFDELLEHYMRLKPDLIVFCSMFYGRVIQDIWAYRCRSYLASAIGMHQNGRIITPFGEVIGATTDNTWYATTRINLDYEIAHIDENSAKFRAAKEKYGRGFTVRDPGGVGCVILESNIEGKSVQDIIEEFGIERMDEYYDRSRQHRKAHYNP